MGAHSSWAWTKASRARIAVGREADEPCHWCHGAVDYSLSGRARMGPTADHVQPLAVTGRAAGDYALDELVIAHRRCNSSRGASLGNRLRAGSVFPQSSVVDSGPRAPSLPEPRTAHARARSRAEGPADPELAPEATGPEIDDSGRQTELAEFEAVWGQYEWMQCLFPVPDTATLPRLMTGPHPRAVGSWGPAAITWIEARRASDPRVPAKAKALRWWQKLVLCRQFEHDSDIESIWSEVLTSTARQVGKSVVLSERSTWRIHEAPALCGEPQLVLHIAKDLAIAREVQRVIRLWAMDIEEAAQAAARAASRNQRLPRSYRPRYIIRGTHGAEEIETGDSSRWLIRGKDSCYGYSASVGEVDEAWGLPPSVVEEGIEATSAERENPQLCCTSTAHPQATPLYPGRRAVALTHLDAVPADWRTLLLEWSADPEWDPGSERAMRAASPHWDQRRARLLAAKHAKWVAGDETTDDKRAGGYLAQWLNIWPTTTGPARWLDARAWSRCITADPDPQPWLPGTPLVVGISLDKAVGQWPVVVAGAVEPPTRIAVRLVGQAPTLADAQDIAAAALAGHRAELVIPRGLRGHVRVAGCRSEGTLMGESDVAAARDLVRFWLDHGLCRAWAATPPLTETLMALPAHREVGRWDAGTMALLAAWWAGRNVRTAMVV